MAVKDTLIFQPLQKSLFPAMSPCDFLTVCMQPAYQKGDVIPHASPSRADILCRMQMMNLFPKYLSSRQENGVHAGTLIFRVKSAQLA